jgi:phosphoribosylglycinamide formyltransferase 1
VTRARIAVLASGGGSNLQALVDHLAACGDARAGDVVLVASDRPASGALSRAARAGVQTGVIRSRFAPDGEFLDALLERHRADLVVLAGYLQLVPVDVTRAYHGRMLNVHPAPLPAFGGAGMYGARVHRSVVAAGAMVSGPTVHFVDEEYDHGATIAHWPVPVLTTDDDHTLAARVLRAEHALFPRVVNAVASDRIRVESLAAPAILPLFDDSLDDRTLGQMAGDALDAAFPAPLSHSP